MTTPAHEGDLRGEARVGGWHIWSPRGAQIWAVAIVTGIAVGAILAMNPVDTVVADIEYDWLVARAAIADDAYRPVTELAEAEGVDIRVVRPLDDAPSVHPRTPGALLVMLPLGLVPFTLLVPSATAVSVAIWTAFCMFWLRDSAVVASRRRFLILVMATFSAPAVINLAFTGQGMLVGALMFAAWSLGIQRRGPFTAAWMMGVATVLKLFPAVLLLVWVRRRQYRLAVSALLTIITLNVLGLLLPGVSLSLAVTTLSQSAENFIAIPANATVAGALFRLGVGPDLAVGVSYALLLVLFAAYLSRNVRDSFGLLLVFTLLFMPVSWTSYDVVVLPFATYLATVASRWPIFPLTPLLLWALLTVVWVDRLPVLLWTSVAARATAALVIVFAALWVSEEKWSRGLPALVSRDLLPSEPELARV